MTVQQCRAAGGPPVADVRATDSLDGVVLTPRNPSDSIAVSSAIYDAIPDVKRMTAGIFVPAVRARSLINLGSDAVDLRWTPEARQLVHNRELLNRNYQHVHQEISTLRSNGVQYARHLLRDIEALSHLDDHQVVNVAAMTVPDSPGLCLFDEQGAGKTVTLIHAFDALVARDEADFLLIFAPKSMTVEWPRDFARFKGDLYRIEVVSGSRRQRLAALYSGADIIVANFEAAVSLEDNLRSLLARHGQRAIITVDESFYVKNLDAQRTRAIRRLREWCGRTFVLCGTPAPNRPHDLVQQFNLVDFGWTFDGVHIPEESDAAQTVIREAIDRRGLYLRHLKVDVLPGLPKKNFSRVIVPMQPVQDRAYAAALENLIIDLRNTDDASFQRHLRSFLARRTALLQICSDPGSIVPGYEETPAKLHALDQIFLEIIDTRKEKVVVWSYFTKTLRLLTDRYQKYSPVRYDGSVTDVRSRREAVRRFQEDSETMLFIGNPAAAGAGLTLHRARVAIYESMSNQAAHYLQSLDRIHRRGQTREVEYLILLCKDTIELSEYDRLTQKERDAHSLLGDSPIEHYSRESLLNELEGSFGVFRGTQ